MFADVSKQVLAQPCRTPSRYRRAQPGHHADKGATTPTMADVNPDAGCGQGTLCAYGDLAFKSYDPTTDYMVFLAQKSVKMGEKKSTTNNQTGVVYFSSIAPAILRRFWLKSFDE